MAELKAKQDTISEFIGQITDGWAELDGKPVVEIRALSEHGGANIARFGLDMLDLAADHARAMNDAKRNVYMCINPVDGDAEIKAGFGAHDRDILAAFYCFADADTDGAMKNILSVRRPAVHDVSQDGDSPVHSRPLLLAAGGACRKPSGVA